MSSRRTASFVTKARSSGSWLETDSDGEKDGLRDIWLHPSLVSSEQPSRRQTYYSDPAPTERTRPSVVWGLGQEAAGRWHGKRKLIASCLAVVIAVGLIVGFAASQLSRKAGGHPSPSSPSAPAVFTTVIHASDGVDTTMVITAPAAAVSHPGSDSLGSASLGSWSTTTGAGGNAISGISTSSGSLASATQPYSSITTSLRAVATITTVPLVGAQPSVPAAAPVPPPPSPPPAVAAPVAVPAGSSSLDQTLALTKINWYRAQHAAGALSWDISLQAQATQWAQYCHFTNENVGQTLAEGNPDIGDAIDEWMRDGPKGQGASNYAQIVWKASTRVGCAVATCNLPDFPSRPVPMYVCQFQEAQNAALYAANVS